MGDMLDELRRVLEGNPDIAYALLFGSGARGALSPTSDVDVAVELRRGAAHDTATLGQLATRLESATRGAGRPGADGRGRGAPGLSHLPRRSRRPGAGPCGPGGAQGPSHPAVPRFQAGGRVVRGRRAPRGGPPWLTGSWRYGRASTSPRTGWPTRA